MKLPEKVTIVEVGPRDGLQNEPPFVPTDDKLELIFQLAQTGIRRIEITSFVHPRAVPQLQDSDAVARTAIRQPGVTYSALVPNEKGLERALLAGMDSIAVFVSASETHNRRNVNMTISDSLQGFARIAAKAAGLGIFIRGYVVTAFGCPLEGKIDPGRVEFIIEEYLRLGITEIALGDTTGMANPRSVEQLLARIFPLPGQASLALHFHDTRGLALANILVALQRGVTIFDGAIGGRGGCPYAPGSSGNVATEDLVHLMTEMGIDTGVNLEALLDCARLAQKLVGRPLPGRLLSAGKIHWNQPGTC
jgi:hydroxymethylglutaryl-CoA lyase